MHGKKGSILGKLGDGIEKTTRLSQVFVCNIHPTPAAMVCDPRGPTVGAAESPCWRILDGSEPRATMPRLPSLERRAPGMGTWCFTQKDLTRHFGWTLDADGSPAMVFTVDGIELRTNRQGNAVAVLKPVRGGWSLAKAFLTALVAALDVRTGDTVELSHAFTVSGGPMRGIMCIDARVRARCTPPIDPTQTTCSKPPIHTPYEHAQTVAALEHATGAKRPPRWLVSDPTSKPPMPMSN